MNAVAADCDIAFKEWAAVCAALAAGRQSIVLRKGGIDEGREGFRIQHREFWLLPTRFHEDASQLAPGSETFWQQPQSKQPSAGKFRIEFYAAVEKVFEVASLAALERLSGEHILSKETVEQRFHYRRPGLFVLAVRVYRGPTVFEVDDSPYIAGCKSWVDLPHSISTTGLQPVLEDREFAVQLERIEELLNDE